MKLFTYRVGACERVGAVHRDNLALDLAAAADALGWVTQPWSSMQALIDGGDTAMAQTLDLVSAADQPVLSSALRRLADLVICAPLPVPQQIRDCLSFEAHLRNSLDQSIAHLASLARDPVAERRRLVASGRFAIPAVWYDQPLYYKANRFGVIGPDQDVTWPPYADRMDYELEFAIVIGRKGKDIARSEAGRHIFGYTILNDFSARDAQLRESAGGLGPAKGKDFDTGIAMGPYIVTPDELAAPYDLTMIARVNGEEQCRASSSSMHHRFDAIIAHISQAETLYPGEIIGSGTVGGGCGLESGRYLADGDVVELEVEGLGVLRNRLIRAH